MGLLDFFRRKNDESVSSSDNSQNADKKVTNSSKPSNVERQTVRSIPFKAPNIPGWERAYENKLPTGLRAAGWYIQKYFKDRNISAPEFRWIQTTLTYPAFQHLCFAYHGNIYSVIMEFVNGTTNHVLSRDTTNQIKECKDNDLIPCTILLNYENYDPIIEGNHLINTETRTPIVFQNRTGNVKMSPWEINNFGVSVVMQQLEKEGKKVKGYCDVLGIEPQIWFDEDNGKHCYVIVKTISGSSKENVEYKINHELMTRLIDYDGYFAEVGISPADDSYDENGKLIPLSERFSMENPKEILYRDKGFYINYRGLQYIEKHAAEKGVIKSTLFDVYSHMD